jgi:hypothetical protein
MIGATDPLIGNLPSTAKFPVRSKTFPVSVQKFPVPLRREFSLQAIEFAR